MNVDSILDWAIAGRELTAGEGEKLFTARLRTLCLVWSDSSRLTATKVPVEVWAATS